MCEIGCKWIATAVNHKTKVLQIFVLYIMKNYCNLAFLSPDSLQEFLKWQEHLKDLQKITFFECTIYVSPI